MLEKWKQWAVKMNYRKAVILFIITGFVVLIGFSVVVYSHFQGRISEWEQLLETDRDYEREEKEFDEEHKFESGEWEHDGDS